MLRSLWIMIIFLVAVSGANISSAMSTDLEFRSEFLENIDDLSRYEVEVLVNGVSISVHPILEMEWNESQSSQIFVISDVVVPFTPTSHVSIRLIDVVSDTPGEESNTEVFGDRCANWDISGDDGVVGGQDYAALLRLFWEGKVSGEEYGIFLTFFGCEYQSI